MRRKDISFLLAVVILVCFAGMGLSCSSGLKKHAAGELGLVYRNAPITREQMEIWWKNAGENEKRYIKDITLWKEPEEVNAANASLGQRTEAQLIRAAGNMNLIMPGKLCAGSLVSSGDRAGCGISRGLAGKLNLDGTGGELQVLGREYQIRGILDVTDAVCIIQGDTGTPYSRVQVKYEDMPASGALQTLLGLLPGEPEVKSEGDLFCGLGGLFLMAPLWVLFVLAAARLRRTYRSAEWKSWVKEICSICFPVAVIAGISILVFFSFRFSDDYIPGAWSDFSFFANLAAEKAGDISKLMTRALDCRDREMLLQTAGCMLSGSVCSVIILKFPRPPFGFYNNRSNHHP